MIELLEDDVWSELQQAARASKRPAYVAVAYFGQGGARMLPLPRGSRLVVDASEKAVKAGQTSPAELAKLVRRGVRVYSVADLHAKVFVFGRTAYVGSTNVSRLSANKLVEATIKTTDPDTVRKARLFIKGLCLHELGQETIKKLQKQYRPPRVAGTTNRARSRKRRGTPKMPRVFLAKLVYEDWPEEYEIAEEEATRIARTKMSHPRRHSLSIFRWLGKCAYKLGDIVVQVVDDIEVWSPGTVVYTRRWSNGRSKMTFVCLEHASLRKTNVDRLAKRLGKEARKRLLRAGRVSNEFARRLLEQFQD